MKDWVSIVLLVSFLRLQVVCCCGSIAHCETSYAVTNTSSAVVCGHSVGLDKQSSAKSISPRENAKASNKSKCSCAKHPVNRAPSVCKIETVAKGVSIRPFSPICGCGHRSCDDHGHHHLYWLTHGNVVPQTKIGFTNAILIQSFDQSFALAFCDEDCKKPVVNTLPLPSPPDLLSLFGHWRI